MKLSKNVKLGSSSATFKFGESGSGFETLAGFEPVARWDIWPGETITEGSTFRPGLIAYSPNGIEKVVFTCNGTDYTVTDMATNPDSGQEEYFPAIDTTGMSGLVEVTAVVHDNNGQQITFDQLPAPFGTVDPQDATSESPGEVSVPFRCVSSAPEVVWIAPEGHIPADEFAAPGTEDNPYQWSGNFQDGDPEKPDPSAVEQIIAAYRPSSTNFDHITTPLNIQMHPGTYTNFDLEVNTWNYTSHDILAKWSFVNPGLASAVVINRQFQITQKSIISFRNVTIDASDPVGDGSEAASNMWFYKSNAESVAIFDSCVINGYKLETVRINGSDVNNWPRLVIANELVDDAKAFFVDCVIEHGRPSLPWSRSCRINKAAHDCAGGSFHVGLTIVDCSPVNVPSAYISDIHCDNWQGFNAGETFSNVILRDWKLYRFYGQGPFFSGNTAEFKRVAIIDCDFGLDNTEGAETGIADGFYMPDPAVTEPGVSPYNGTGYAVDLYGGTQGQPWDGSYDNSRLDNWALEQRLNIVPGTGTVNGNDLSIDLQGELTDWYVKGCTIFSRSQMKLRGFTSTFHPTAINGTRVVFEDNFDEDGKLFIPGSDFTESKDDRSTFKALVLDDTYLQPTHTVDAPDLTTPYSSWTATATPEPGYVSVYTTGAIYRTTTGLDPDTQYPTDTTT